ncbi:unnamed protein product [Penicillium roqueforti FM164]|uniref:Protein kinase-like domain n=1 Tax=Penicillium roqueforti (strain FM164) TaxID=1365484 RepID=W6QUJ4_PENRF|nr:unnamed protein product [Penicillium roqueforti FM164]
MKTSFEMPFYATELPCPLPTGTEIENAPDLSMRHGGRRIVGVGQHFVVKFGLGVDLIEGESMLFVRYNTNIPIPRVFALYSDLEIGKNFIVMECVLGQILLSGYFDNLCQLLSLEYFGSLNQRQLLDDIFWTQEPDLLVNGPFNSEGDLNEAILRKYTYNGGPYYRAEYLQKCFPFVFKGNKATFTHRKSGWYPGYWEYCLAVCALRWDDDWSLWIDGILSPCVSEAAYFQSLRLELWS